MINTESLQLPEVILIEPRLFTDNRGFFFESYNLTEFDAMVGRTVTFVQDNHSKSKRGVLRGLHYQLSPHDQGKLVRVAVGEIFDVAVDLRRGSPTFGKWAAAILSATNRRQMWIPEGFAHGFLTLSEHAEVLYKATAPYSPNHERAVRWDDPTIAIDWPVSGGVLISAKDAAAPILVDAEAS